MGTITIPCHIRGVGETVEVVYWKWGTYELPSYTQTVTEHDRFTITIPKSDTVIIVGLVPQGAYRRFERDGQVFEKYARSRAVEFAVFPGDTTLEIVGELTDSLLTYKVIGSDVELRKSEYERDPRYIRYQIARDRLEQELDLMRELGNRNPEDYRRELQAGVDRWKDSIIYFRRDYIFSHPDDELSVTYLLNLPFEYWEECLEVLTEEATGGRMSFPFGEALPDYYQYKARERFVELLHQPEKLPDCYWYDPDGEQFDVPLLYNQGKYIVMDFWATWSMPCVKGLPKLREYYERYGDRLEIVSVGFAEPREKWVAGVAEYDSPWNHVYNENTDAVKFIFDIESIPFKIVVSPSGEILRKFNDEEEFYQYLDELLGEGS